MGGTYSRQYQAWALPLEKAAAASGYQSARATSRWARGPRQTARDIHTAVDFQAYIERAELSEQEASEQIVHDQDGPISFGTLGEAIDERKRFWTTYADTCKRCDARIQSRIILELPHELALIEDGPVRIRRLAERVAAPLQERRLPFHLVAHWPEVDKGTDERNLHLHIVYGERPTTRLAPYRWEIGKVDRSARGDGVGGGAWVIGLRARYCEVLNDALSAIGAAKRYDPRPYAESGVQQFPGAHLGPARVQLERAGISTALGISLGRQLDQKLERELVERQQRRGEAVAVRVGRVDDADSGRKLLAAAEHLAAAERQALLDEAGRLRLHLMWLAVERGRAARRAEKAVGEKKAKERERLRAIEAQIAALPPPPEAQDHLPAARRAFEEAWRACTHQAKPERLHEAGADLPMVGPSREEWRSARASLKACSTKALLEQRGRLRELLKSEEARERGDAIVRGIRLIDTVRGDRQRSR